jgi:hypothetical protein
MGGKKKKLIPKQRKTKQVSPINSWKCFLKTLWGLQYGEETQISSIATTEVKRLRSEFRKTKAP